MRTSLSDLSAGIDWLTTTYRDDRTIKEVGEWAGNYERVMMQAGEESYDMNSYGYQGWRCCGMGFGIREDGAILSLAGSLAAEKFSQVKTFGGKCTRIDLQVTASLMNPETGLARRHYNRLMATQEPLPQKVITLLESKKGGQTLYLGARSSEQMGRIYDKSSQERLGEPGSRWRFEVEYKGARAPQVWAHLTHEPTRATIIGSTVWEWFNSRGVSPVWDKTDKEVVLEVPRRASSVDRQLLWLATQVAPTVARLVAAGRQSDVLRSLGMESERWQ